MTTITDKHRKTSRSMMIGFAVLCLALSFTPGAKLVVLLLPLGAIVLGFRLLPTPTLYVPFVLWLFTLTPFLRRVVEWRGSGGSANTVQFIMTAPFLAAVVGLAVWRRDWTALPRAIPRQWTFIVMALAYCTVVGFLIHHVAATLPDVLGWSCPLCFALYLFFERNRSVEILNVLRENMLWGLLITGLYGLYQFFFMTPWDIAWMEASNLTSIGTPEPYGVRVFSTLNTPQPYADYLIFGLLMCLTSNRRLRFFVAPIAILNLGLTMSRSSWVAAVVAFCYVALTLTAKQRMQLIAIGAACFALLSIATLVPEINDILTQRLQTFQNLKDDGSANDRIQSQREAVQLFSITPFGLGFGADAGLRPAPPSHGHAALNYVTISDNGIEEMALTMGWFASIVFLVGFGGSVLAIFRFPASPGVTMPRAMVLALLIQIPVLGIFPGVSGFFLWTSIAMAFSEGMRPRAASVARLPWVTTQATLPGQAPLPG